MKNIGWISPFILSIACATTTPPSELVDARQSYARSERSQAARYNPAAVHDARVALDRAEKLYDEEGDEPEVRDAAYVAQRRAEQALVEGETSAIQLENEQVARAAEQERTQAAKQTQTDLQATRAELQETQQAHEDAEARARDALLELQASQTAGVKEGGDGQIITIGGQFLFPSNKATLLPAANAKLDQVANALKQQEDKRILIEGHTDSSGSAEHNLQLSKERAETVAAYLSARGVASDKIMTDGVGAERPIAENESAEGRATNRRVEITVQEPSPEPP